MLPLARTSIVAACLACSAPAVATAALPIEERPSPPAPHRAGASVAPAAAPSRGTDDGVSEVIVVGGVVVALALAGGAAAARRRGHVLTPRM
jgi:hypothetical protein